MIETICGIEFKLVKSNYVKDFWDGNVCDTCTINLIEDDDFGYYCECFNFKDYLTSDIYKTKEEAVQKILDKIKTYCNNRVNELWLELKAHSNIVSKINNL
jgi:hypothetical protein